MTGNLLDRAVTLLCGALLGGDQARAVKPIGLGKGKLVARLGLVVRRAVEAELVPGIVLPIIAKVGGGWVGNNNFTVTNLTTGASFTCGTFNLTNCGNNTGGWLLGAGFEYAFTNNWTVKLEYDYLGLGNRTFFIPATAPFLAGDTFTSNNRNVQMVKVGFNYLFNWGAPVAARY